MAWRVAGRFLPIPSYPLASPVSFVASGSYRGFSDKLFIFTWFGYEKRDDRFSLLIISIGGKYHAVS